MAESAVQSGNNEADVKYVTVAQFCKWIGYTKPAVYNKIYGGVWLEGKHFRRAPDGRILINLSEFYTWVEG